MLRLFKIMKGNEAVYFNNKAMAKLERDALIAEGKTAVVMRGPDHRKGESFNKSSQTPSSKRFVR
jgi:hypothetical protein